MTSTGNTLGQMSTMLNQILQRPEAFGLGKRVPRPLADSLETVLKMLRQALNEPEELIPDGDFEAEAVIGKFALS